MANGRAWSAAELAVLRRDFATVPTPELARAIGRPLHGVRSKALDMGLRKRAPFKSWTRGEIRTLRSRYADTLGSDLVRALARPLHQIYAKARKLGLRKAPGFASRVTKAKIATGWRANGKAWSQDQLELLKARYPHEQTKVVAAACAHSISSTHQTAKRLGLKKTKEYLASPQACRLRRGDNVGAKTRFPKGHVPANKGLRRPGWSPGRMSETQFKKGQMAGAAQRKWVPIGTEVVDANGYLKRKISDDRAKPSRFNWRYVHVLLWEERYGPIPRGYCLVFIDGNRKSVVLDNLCLVGRQELMRLNTVHNLPPQLVHAVQLRAAIVRRINRRTRDEQHRHPA